MIHKLKTYLSNDFLRNIMTLVSASGIAQAISLLIYPVLTRIYTPEEHGMFSLYLSIVTIAGIVSTGKYEQAILIPKKDSDGVKLTELSVLLSFAFSIFLMLFIILFSNKIPVWLKNEDIARWIWFIPLSTFSVAIFQTLGFWYNRKKYYKDIAIANLGQSLVNSAVKLSASKALSSGGGLVVGAIIGQVAGAVYFVVRLLKDGLSQFLTVSFRDLRIVARKYVFFPKYTMPLRLINNFSSSLPVFVFSIYFSSAEVGFFGLGFMLLNRPMNLLSNSITKVFSQKVIADHNQGMLIAQAVRKFVIRMFLIITPPFVIAAVFGPFLVSLIFGEDWYEAGRYVRIFVPWLLLVFPSAPLSFLADILSMQKKAMWIEVVKFVARIIALAIGVVLNDVLIALYLFSGVSAAVVTYNLFWYLKLTKFADAGKKGDENEI